MPGKIESTPRADGHRDRRNAAIAADKSGGADDSSGKRLLQHCLKVWAPADVAVADYEYASRPVSSRDAPDDGLMTTLMQEPVRKVASRVISAPEDAAC